ncbi:trans-resveratrol di-O-methyltransferase-like [Gossypium australe]|uniref:Trans-resveratrol di-O-methyltransferase-like n=1 Tax=Gossypium australe TaxID=47621 RepID=A0A5B6X2M9_9ROSI|nr:trans-resveratrol di-O-methyltransferase-like [Gossypium australe]
MLFRNTLKSSFINHMLGTATKSLSDIVMSGEMIENVVRSEKIDAGENTKRSAPRKKENGVNTASVYKGYSKSVTIGQPRTITTSHQGPSRQESNSRSNIEKLQFTPIPMTYRVLYQNLFNAHVVSPFYLKPMQPPFPKWYDANAQREYHMIDVELIAQDSEEVPKGMRSYCEFHAEEGHEIQECTKFKALVQSLMDNNELEFFEDVKGSEGGDIYALEEGSVEKVSKDIGFYTRTGRPYDLANITIEPVKGKTLEVEHKKANTARLESPVNKPVIENEAKELLKFLKHSENSVIEQLHKQPARISVLALLLSL